MTDPANLSRRQAIRYLVSGAAAAVCPFPVISHAKTASSDLQPKLASELNKICHEVRDGVQFKFPRPSAHYDAVIVGGGPSGLMAAYHLRDVNFLLLEKEPRLGGDALSEEWNGQWYSTGSAYGEGEKLRALCSEIGMQIYPIRSTDAAMINNQLVPDFWAGGFQSSPYPDGVKKNFARFLADMKALNTQKNSEKLDTMSFAELLKPYGPELKLWYDNFGPNNWGADAENTSALVGAESVRWAGGIDPNRYTWPGGLGRISLALEGALEKSGAGRIHKGATVVRVENAGSGVEVTSFENDELVTVAARSAIIACPKFIGKKIVKGLPCEQFQAMDAIRYAPYLVANICSREVIYNGSYDTNVPAPSVVVDFNVADWVENRDNPETKRPAVLTCYLPRPEMERVRFLDDDYVMGLGKKAVEELNTWFPGAREKVEEVRLYRRGHPMFLSAPGVTTRLAPVIRRPFGNILFAHSDSEGDVSTYESALTAALRTSKEMRSAITR